LKGDRHADKGTELGGRPIAGIRHVVLELAFDPAQPARLAAVGGDLEEARFETLALLMEVTASMIVLGRLARYLRWPPHNCQQLRAPCAHAVDDLRPTGHETTLLEGGLQGL